MAEPTPSFKRLTRSRRDRVIAGICGGLGEYFAIDPTIVRVIFIALLFGGGFGILLYLVLWLIVPEEGSPDGPFDVGERMKRMGDEVRASAEHIASEARGSQPSSRRTLFAGTVILFGVWLLLEQWFSLTWFRWETFWPVVIIIVGLSLIIRR